MIFPLHLHIVNFSTYTCKSFFDVGAAFAVPKYSKFYLYEYRLYCIGAAFAVPKYCRY